MVTRAKRAGEDRLIKKYPNRRLYDTQTSTYVTLSDIKNLVMANEPIFPCMYNPASISEGAVQATLSKLSLPSIDFKGLNILAG